MNFKMTGVRSHLKLNNFWHAVGGNSTSCIVDLNKRYIHLELVLREWMTPLKHQGLFWRIHSLSKV